MTITIVCDILGEENNGTTIACMNLIRYLRAQGHTVRVVCADQDKAGNECFYVVPERNLYLLNPIVERNGVTLPRVDRAILEEAIRDCDVVHTTFVAAPVAHGGKDRQGIQQAHHVELSLSGGKRHGALSVQGLGRHQPRRVPRVLPDGVQYRTSSTTPRSLSATRLRPLSARRTAA